MRPRARVLLAAAAAVALAGCTRDAGGTITVVRDASIGASQAQPIELFSWWGPVGHSDPVRALIAVHKQRFPNDYVISAKTLLSGRAHKTIKTRLESGDPPDVIQSNAGYDQMRWVLVNGVDARDSKLLALDAVLDDVATWRKVIPPKLLELMTHDGKLYGAPAGIHRVNTLFYNKRVFAGAGLPPPRTVADLEAAGRKLHEAGIPLFAVGAKEPWPIGYLVFESLLLSREGPEFYRRYFSGAAAPDDPRVVRTLEKALQLLQYTNPNWSDVSFVQAGELVAQGKAAATVAGDWMSVYFDPAGLSDADAVAEIAFPGTESTFVVAADMFSIPRAAHNVEGAKRLLSTLGSPEAQRTLARVKGCLSPRSDVSLEPGTAIQRDKARLLREGELVFALSGMVPSQFHDDVNWSLVDMLKERDVEPVVEALRSRYYLLSASRRTPAP